MQINSCCLLNRRLSKLISIVMVVDLKSIQFGYEIRIYIIIATQSAQKKHNGKQYNYNSPKNTQVLPICGV